MELPFFYSHCPIETSLTNRSFCSAGERAFWRMFRFDVTVQIATFVQFRIYGYAGSMSLIITRLEMDLFFAVV